VTFDSGSRTTVGDWVVECVTDGDPEEGACQLYQRVLTQDPNTAAMVAAMAWSPSEDALRIQVSLPLGADLREPPVLGIDGNVAAAFVWSRCLASGCLVEAPMADDLVAALMQGENASITVVQPNAGGIGIPLSLNGFVDALAMVMPEDAIPDEQDEDNE
jgi:invasion protein IalB